MPERRTVALVTLGCARNEVDSEELAGRLAADGWELVEDAADADVAVVNTCGFVEAAKKDSVDALLEANDLKDHGRTQAVVAVGCMAERYGKELAEALPEADGVLGFDDYADISDRLQTILNGGIHASHTPRDRRKLLPLSPAERQDADAWRCPATRRRSPPAPRGPARRASRPASGPRAPLRRRLDTSPVASVKLASGCDRRCSFCAIPSFRGSFISRRPSRRARRDPLAGRAGRQGGHAGLREQHLVRQGPRRHPAAGDAAARAGRRRRHRAGPGQLPPARRDAARADRRADLDRRRSRRTSTCPSSTPRPACCARCAASATPTASWSCWRPSAARPRRRACGPTSSSASPARPRRTSPSWSASSPRARLDAIGVFGYSDEDGTEAAGVRGQARRRTSSPSGSRTSRGWPRS